MNAARVGRAAFAAPREAAGTIASRNGRPSVTPTPRRNVRRGRAIFLMTTKPRLSAALSARLLSFLNGPSVARPGLTRVLHRLHVAHLKRHARHDARDHRGKPVVARTRA